MSTQSRYRTTIQSERITAAQVSGYVWQRDSDYQLKQGRGRGAPVSRGCLSILKGNPTGHWRNMIVYPDGSVETQAENPRNDTRITYNRAKLSKALASHGHGRSISAMRSVVDEDEHFMEAQQR